MKRELKRIDPFRAANILALLYLLVTGVFALIFFPFFLLAGLVVPADGPGLSMTVMALLMVFFYPIIGAVMGWVSGALCCAIYNFIIRWTGGFLLEFDGA